MKVLVDTNVVLDVFMKRQPFYEDSFAVFQRVGKQDIEGCLSSTSMTDIFYLLRKFHHGSTNVYPIMDDLAVFFSIVPVFDTTIVNALALRWNDFEDAVQFMVAKENGITHIVTRNQADYKNADIQCLRPADFIAYLENAE